jgi:hypothetical protein
MCKTTVEKKISKKNNSNAFYPKKGYFCVGNEKHFQKGLIGIDGKAYRLV